MADRVHATSVPGYEDTPFELVRLIHDMRYDEVVKFYRRAAEELRRQAEGDRGRNRPVLARKLDEAARQADELGLQIEAIWKLCKPHTL